MTEKATERSILAERFWTNVTITMMQQKKTFLWLERTADIPCNMARSAKSKGTRLRLSMALRIAKVLGIELEELLYGHYELISIGANERDL